MTPFDDIPLVDGHLHPLLLTPETHPFARYFTEADDTASVTVHVPQTLFYRRAIGELAEILHCAARAEAVQEARRALGQRDYLRLLVRASNVETLLVDDGYPPDGAVRVQAMGEQAGCAAHRVLRIETQAESLFPESRSARDLADRVLAAIEAEPERVALKTIVAYRCGLQVTTHAAAEVDAAFHEVRAACGLNPPRLTSKPLLDFLLLRTLEWAADQGIPVQFHTGYGDRDIDLPSANPALLRSLLEEPRFERLTVILLHASYPYCREASYLALVYPRVYVDWSEVNPMLPPRQLQRVLEELLALAPYSKLLYGSDAWGIPDWIYLAARAGRAALAAVLAGEADADTIARRILRETARDVYHLDD